MSMNSPLRYLLLSTLSLVLGNTKGYSQISRSSDEPVSAAAQGSENAEIAEPMDPQKPKTIPKVKTVEKPSNPTQPPSTNQDPKTLPEPKAIPDPQAIQQPPRPEPIQAPVSESSKSLEQRTYESEMNGKFEDFASRIKVQKDRIEGLPDAERRYLRPRLRTAEGNRSVARTKLKQLKFVKPSAWFTLKSEIEKALANLEEAVKSLERQGHDIELNQTK